MQKHWIPAAIAVALAGAGVGWPQTVQNPRRIAEGPRGQVLVTDRSHGSIVAVDKDTLDAVWSFELEGEGAPFGLAACGRRVYVGNTKTKNVEVYHAAGRHGGFGAPECRKRENTRHGRRNRKRVRIEFLYNLGHVPRGRTGFIDNPVDIAVDAMEKLVFVLDSVQKQIKIFDHNGSFVSAFFPTDTDGQLLSPVSLAVDGTRREVLVGDYGDPSGSFRAETPARILIYTYEGSLRFQIDGDGSTHETALFTRVQGLVTGAGGRVIAADPLGSRILVLDRSSGALLSELGTAGDQPGQLMLPLDVLLDKKTGDVFVSNNRGAQRVEALRGAGR